VNRLKIKKSWLFMAFLSSLSLILSSCATMSDSSDSRYWVWSGSRCRSSPTRVKGDQGTSAAIGAVVGGLSAYLIHKGVEKREEKVRRETLLNLDKFDVSTPPKSGTVSIPAGGGHYLTKPVDRYGVDRHPSSRRQARRRPPSLEDHRKTEVDSDK
jgi:hypothetical protein